MNLYHLRYFVTLAKYEHYTKAADHLLITQPTLSNAITSLENELGVQLFEKKGRNITLTSVGKMFLDTVQQSLNILDNGIEEAQLISKGKGHIRIGTLRILSQRILPKICSSFLENTEDNITFSFSNGKKGGTSYDLIECLINNEADIVFCSKPRDNSILQNKEIQFIPIEKQKLIAIVPSNHTLSQNSQIDLEELIKYPFVSFTKSSAVYNLIKNFLKINDINQHINKVYEIQEDDSVAGLVGEGFGVAIIPEINILNTLPVKKLEITHCKSSHQLYYMAYLKNSYMTPAHQRFIEYVINDYQLEDKTSDK